MGRRGQTWQWVMIGADNCGSSSVWTGELAVTANAFQAPCCPPGAFQDNRNSWGTQQCVDQNLCMCGARECKLLHEGCGADLIPDRCPSWKNSGALIPLALVIGCGQSADEHA